MGETDRALIEQSHLPERCAGCSAASVTAIVPCHNERLTIQAVVRSLRRVLPGARIIVGDNSSDDGTGQAAAEAGAEVVKVPARGKGRTVRRLTEMCTSDVVIMIDGDNTYDPGVAPALVHLVYCEGYDLVNVERVEPLTQVPAGDPYRAAHRFGNRMLTGLQRALTGIELRDILTGYKAMSRRFVTSFPVRSHAFQLEVEIAAHAVALDFAYTETSAPYAARIEGSTSKLSTYRDGASILRTILRLHRDLHPMTAFSVMSAPWFLASFALVAAPAYEYFDRGEVPRFPSLIAGMALFVVAMLLVTSGWLLSRITRMRRDLLQLAANDLERGVMLNADAGRNGGRAAYAVSAAAGQR